jgi:hypothetical protein
MGRGFCKAGFPDAGAHRVGQAAMSTDPAFRPSAFRYGDVAPPDIGFLPGIGENVIPQFVGGWMV